jgi:DNA modification methylase
MAEMLKAAPELFADCKTKKDAEKRVRKVGEELILDELVSRIKAGPADRQRQLLMDSFILKDFFEGVKSIPDGSIDLVEVDPPYAIDLQEYKKHYDAYLASGDIYNEVPVNDYPSFIQRLLKELHRVMAANSWLIMWFGQDPWFEPVYQWITQAGFSCSRMFGAWIKPTGQSMRPELYLANSIECFFYARKGEPTIAKPGRVNSFVYSPVVAEKKVHPTERPGELIREILLTFGRPSMRVLVPCCGSGITLLEAHKLGMQPVGFELSKRYRDSFLVKAHQLIGG